MADIKQIKIDNTPYDIYAPRAEYADAITVTNALPMNSAYIPLYTALTGNLSPQVSDKFYVWSNDSSSYLNVGKTGWFGGISFHTSGATYTNLVPTSNLPTNNTIYLPTGTGTIALKSDIDNLIDGAPGALDTLNELSAALGDDKDFAATVTNLISGIDSKVDDEIERAVGVEGSLQTQINGKAPTSHGTHVTADTVKEALGVSTDGTKFLKENGTWATPTDNKVKQNAVVTTNANYPVFFATDTTGAAVTTTINKAEHFLFNPSTDTLKTANVELTGNVQLQGSIKYKGTKATSDIIRFIDNTADVNGNGIAIGGGGTTVIGGGESASLIVPDSGGNERMVITNDQAIEFYSGCQSGLDSAQSMTFEASGNLQVPQLTVSKAESGQDSLIRSVSTQTATDTDQVWRGRIVAGAKNKTFLLGVYKNMCGIGAHYWTDALAASGAGWEDIYFNPDGGAKIYLGGSGWTKNSGVMKIENAVKGAYLNIGTLTSPIWSKVSYHINREGENDSDYSSSGAYSYVIGKGTAGDESMVWTDASDASAGNQSVLIGGYSDDDPSAGDNSVVIGNSATATDNSVVIGSLAKGTFSNAVAIGYNSSASTTGATAIGQGAAANGANSVGIGQGVTAGSHYSIAIGNGAYSGQTYAVALGYSADATATGAIAIGYNPTSSGYYSIAVGHSSKATYTGAIALGYSADATATGAIAIGYNPTSSGLYSIGLGYRASSASRSIMIGANVSSSLATIEANAIGIGTGASAQTDSAGTFTPRALYAGTGAVAIGSAYGEMQDGWAVVRDAAYARYFGIAIGAGATATGSNAVSLGTNTTSYGVVVGSSSKAYGSNCIAIGSVAYAGSSSYLNSTSPSQGAYSIAIGYGVSAGISSSRSLIKIGQTSHNTYFYSGTSASWSSGSDIRDKTNIQPIYGGIDLIKNIQPISFQYNYRNTYSDTGSFLDYDIEEHKKATKADDELKFGFAAQEVANYFDRVYGDEKINNIVGHDYEVDADTGETADYYSIAEGGFIPFLFQAIKEQQDVIESLEERIIKLEKILTKEG